MQDIYEENIKHILFVSLFRMYLLMAVKFRVTIAKHFGEFYKVERAKICLTFQKQNCLGIAPETERVHVIVKVLKSKSE